MNQLLKFIGWVTGYTKRRIAEEKWKSQYGEIPDRFCLIYDGDSCFLRLIL